MRRGLHAQHDLYIAGSVVASFNQPKSAGTPRAPIDAQKGILGWRTTADGDDAQNDMPAGRMGEVPYPRTTRGKTLTYNVVPQVAWADGLDGLEDYMDELEAACSDLSSLALIVARPWPGLSGSPGDVWGAFCRVLAFTADELQSRGPTSAPSPWQRDAQFSVRLLDGRWLWLNESGTLFERMSWSAAGSGANVVVTNNGRAPAEPLITVQAVAAGDDVHLGRAATGPWPDQTLWLRDPVAGAGLSGSHDVVVDFAGRKVTVEGVYAKESYDAAASDWWDEYVWAIPPGAHDVFVGPGAGTGLEVSLYSTSW